MKSPISVGHGILEVTSAAAVGLAAGSSGIPANAQSADIYTDKDIRVWLDGTAPTASEGLLIGGGTTFQLESPAEISGFRAIAVTATANLMINYKDA